MGLVINMKTVRKGQTENHLIFEGYVPALDNSRLYEFDFIGTDLTTDASLTPEQTEGLKNELKKEYGYAPYDEKDAKKKLEKRNQYRIAQ